NPLTRITRTVLYIYTKIAFRRGERNPYNPLLMGPPASSNFYTREIKKMRHAGGRDADMVSHIPEISTSTATAE
ncbi:hypothetical protein, partial [Escherichia coli]|uniref:hypothetical protein n=1 Tax=Escherichia coli TaxID=562 RepID=UPI001F2CCBE0